MKGKAGENKSRYPSRINCKFIDEEFRGGDQATYKRYAEADKEHTMINQGIG